MSGESDQPRCIRCGGTDDLMDVAMAPGMTYCASCRRSLHNEARAREHAIVKGKR